MVFQPQYHIVLQTHKKRLWHNHNGVSYMVECFMRRELLIKTVYWNNNKVEFFFVEFSIRWKFIERVVCQLSTMLEKIHWILILNSYGKKRKQEYVICKVKHLLNSYLIKINPLRSILLSALYFLIQWKNRDNTLNTINISQWVVYNMYIVHYYYWFLKLSNK